MLGTASALLMTVDGNFKELEEQYAKLKRLNVGGTAQERWERDMKLLQTGLQLEQLRIKINTM